ncbi:MAG: tol-pal system YbgF family protein, partial [Thermoanaerobaculia bacterium]
QALRASEEPLAALEALDRSHAYVSYQDVFASPFFSRSYERYLKAETLAELGRFEEAIRWFSSFAELSFWDVAFLAPSFYRRAQIYDQLGRENEAKASYEEFLRLWADAEPELQDWIGRAESRVSELAKRPAG